MSDERRAARCLVNGLLAALAVLAVGTSPVSLRPGDPLWRLTVSGAGPGGLVRDTALVFVPGVDRSRPLTLILDASDRDGGEARIGVSASAQGSYEWQNVAAPAPWTIPATDGPGLKVRLRVDGRPARLSSVELHGSARPAILSAALAFVVGLLGAWVLARLVGPALAVPLALLLAGACGLAATPLVLVASLARPAVLVRALVPVGLVGAGLAMGLKSPGARRPFALGATLVAAAVFGAAIRAAFAPSLGSWDLDYWKACARRVTTAGVTQAYGGSDAVPPGHFLVQLRGREAPWETPSFGKTFVVDQPPAMQALWGLGLRWTEAAAVGLSPEEVENVGAKTPPLLGDVLAVAVLLTAFRFRPVRGAGLAAAYWALPISWLSSALMGYIDGALAPLVVAAVLAAGRGRARTAGVLFGAAALVKATAVLAAPAIVVALWVARAPIRRAVAWGVGLVLAALAPFAFEGTLTTAVVHCARVVVQRRLSGGFGNAWWILSWLHGIVVSGRSPTEDVAFVETHALPLNVLGTALFFAAAFWIGRSQVRHPGPSAAALAAAALIVAYGQTAIGVHENHTHVLVLAFLASGLATARLQRLAGVLFSTYVLNMLALSGLGRFSGLRHLPLEPLIAAVKSFRSALGLDVTLVLALINVAATVWLLRVLPEEMAAAQAAEAPTVPAPRV